MMATKRCYYETLAVEKTASAEDLKRAYRKLAMQYHPDRNPGDAEAEVRFKEVSEAYAVLSDEDKRSRYDRYGHAGLDGSGGGPQFHDLGSIFDLFGDIFGMEFGGRGRRGGHGGVDLQVQLEIDLLEAARGAKRSLEFERAEVCGECQGTRLKRGSRPVKCSRCQGRGVLLQRQGFFQMQVGCPACGGMGEIVTDPCATCRGQGKVAAKRRLEVNIPPGVDSGSRIRLSGEGEAGDRGGPRGDLYCLIRVKAHPLFQREGAHLLCEVPITFSQAALGAEIEVPTLEGKQTLAIHKGVRFGEVMKLRGQGMPDLRGGRRGDLHVRLVIETPRKLTKRQEELYRELADLDHKHVSPERKSFLDRLYGWFTAADEKPPEKADVKPAPEEKQP